MKIKSILILSLIFFFNYALNAYAFMKTNQNNIIRSAFKKTELKFGLNFEDSFRNHYRCESQEIVSCLKYSHEIVLGKDKLIIYSGSSAKSGWGEAFYKNVLFARGEFTGNQFNGKMTQLMDISPKDFIIRVGTLKNQQYFGLALTQKKVDTTWSFFHRGKAFGYQKNEVSKNEFDEMFLENGKRIGNLVLASPAGIAIADDERGMTFMFLDWDKSLCYWKQCDTNTFINASYFFKEVKYVFNKLPINKRKKIQKNLKDLNYYSSKIDGVWGYNTIKAIVRYSAIYENIVPVSRDIGSDVLRNLLDFDVNVDRYKPGENRDHKRKTFESAGSGFYINREGSILTNRHVVEVCNEILVHSLENATPIEAKISHQSNVSDLAIIETTSSNAHFLKFSIKPENILDEIIVAGYPFGNKLNSNLKVTKGIISSLTGLDDDNSEFQMDAAIQPGNSGGPVINENGEVVGVVAYKLNNAYILSNFGSLPENTNFAIKSSHILNLEKISDKIPDNNLAEGRLKNLNLGDRLTKSVVRITCKF